MNKTELVQAIVEESGITKDAATKAVDGFMAVVTKALANREKVQLVGFGTFETRERSGRTGRNPQTGEQIEIAASTVPAFKPGNKLKESI